MFVVKGTSLISSHQCSVQHFYKVFFFYPYSISTPPSSFVVKGTSLISSHQCSVQHFYKVFFFILILFPLLPLRFHFCLIFFSSILLYYISVPVLQ